MNMTRVFNNGNSQAVRIPAEYRIHADEVIIQKIGSALILLPKDSVWQAFSEALDSFAPDFRIVRQQPLWQERADFDEE